MTPGHIDGELHHAYVIVKEIADHLAVVKDGITWTQKDQDAYRAAWTAVEALADFR